MMAPTQTCAGLIFGVLLLLGAVMTGGVFYSVVLPKFQLPPPPVVPPPTPKVEPVYPLIPTRKPSIPQLVTLPRTTLVRLAYDTSSTPYAWGLANMGKVTDPGSILARHGITMEFRRLENLTERIAALHAMAAAFNKGDTGAADKPVSLRQKAGVHFFTVGGDTSRWVISQTNMALQTVHREFEAEIIGFSGVSAGEDTFMGLAEWHENPQKAIGGMVAGVPYASGWNVLVFWCAQHVIPFNADQTYYDPKALNFVETESPATASAMYIDKKTVERIFLTAGQDRKGYEVLKGRKGVVAINGVVTRTPWEKHLASRRGGLVTIASTKHYPNQAPQFLVGLKQWNRQHQDVVANMLAALFEASQLIDKSYRDVKAKRLEPKANDDYRWQAAQYVYEMFETESPSDWYAYYEAAVMQDKRDLPVDVGGAAVATLQRNFLFFGLGNAGPDRGKVIYDRFAQLAQQYGMSFVENAPAWEQAFNKAYLQEVFQRFPALAQADPTLPTFVVANNKAERELTYHLPFAKGKETFGPESEAILNKFLEQIVMAGDAPIEIHGHTDSYGSAESNMDLSRRRGEAVYNWLQQKLGAAFPKHVQVVPHGGNDLLVKDQIKGEYIPELMAQNRRVVLKIGSPANNP